MKQFEIIPGKTKVELKEASDFTSLKTRLNKLDINHPLRYPYYGRIGTIDKIYTPEEVKQGKDIIVPVFSIKGTNGLTWDQDFVKYFIDEQGNRIPPRDGFFEVTKQDTYDVCDECGEEINTEVKMDMSGFSNITDSQVEKLGEALKLAAEASDIFMSFKNGKITKAQSLKKMLAIKKRFDNLGMSKTTQTKKRKTTKKVIKKTNDKTIRTNKRSISKGTKPQPKHARATKKSNTGRKSNSRRTNS